MLKRKALKKIMITTLTVCLLLAIYLMPSNDVSTNKFNQGMEIKYSDNIGKIGIYLLNNDDLLVKTVTVVDNDKDINEKTKSILTNLLDASNDLLPNGLNGIIPKKTKILNVSYTEGIVSVDFSSEILGVKENRRTKLLEAVTFSLLEIEGVNGVKILVEGKAISNHWGNNLPEVFTKEFGINKKYDIRKRKDIQKVVVYYIDEIEGNKYYVPITKYIDDNREKISIIIDDLSSSYIYEPNLVSYLNQRTELINYEIDSDTMILNFNTSIFMSDNQILEEVVYSIMYSIFDNYDVREVIFQVDNEEILKKSLKDVEFINQ